MEDLKNAHHLDNAPESHYYLNEAHEAADAIDGTVLIYGTDFIVAERLDGILLKTGGYQEAPREMSLRFILDSNFKALLEDVEHGSSDPELLASLRETFQRKTNFILAE